MGKAHRLKKAAATAAPLKLDFGCGANKREGFIGVDRLPFAGVDVVHNLASAAAWPWADGSVAEAHASHFLEHLTARQRVRFVNELYRVLVPGGTCQIIVPHWASCRAYGDPTHEWPPVSEFWFYYLNRDWRIGDVAKGLGPNAPHTDIAHTPDGFNCNFSAGWGYTLHPTLQTRHVEMQQFATGNYKEACQDIVATLTKVA